MSFEPFGWLWWLLLLLALLILLWKLVDLRFANHAAPGAAADLRLVPKAKAQREGKEICNFPAYDAGQFVAEAWAGLVARYSEKEFVDAGWTLVATRVTSKAAIDTLLSDIKALAPLKLAVHYVGPAMPITRPQRAHIARS